MNNRLSNFLTLGPFFKNVSTLAFGTVISQSILLASSPLLTRLFNAQDFGILAVFTSISTIAAILTTGRYELVIGLPKVDLDALRVTLMVLFLGSIISLIFFLLIILGKFLLPNGIGEGAFSNSFVVYFIPVYTFFAACISAMQYWHQRNKNYKKISISNALQVAGATFFNLLFGILGFTKYGLVFGLLIGQFTALFVLVFKFTDLDLKRIIDFRKFKEIAKRYIEFPKYMIVSDLSISTSQQLIPIIFSFLFSSTVVGYFSLANRMLRIPSIVLTSSVSNVFRNEAIDMIRLTGNCNKLYLSTLKKLGIISLPIYLILSIASPWLFLTVFGTGWVESGYFAQIICIMAIFDFLAFPLNSLFYVLGKQKLYMRLQFANMIMSVVAIYMGYKFFNEAYYAIIFFAISNAVFSMICLYYTYGLSKEKSVIN